MKVRSDFVSNSSSSSFVFANASIFQFFDITKDDVLNALIELYGKDNYQAFLNEHTKEAAEKHAKENPESRDYYCSEEYYKQRPFYVYDLSDPKDREVAIKDWGNLLEGWDQRKVALREDDIDVDPELDSQKAFSEFLHVVNKMYDCYIHQGTEKDLAYERIHDTELDKKLSKIPLVGNWLASKLAWKKLPEHVRKTIVEARAKLGIKTNLDVLKMKEAKFFIHFDDNEVASLAGTDATCKADFKDDEIFRNDDYDGEEIRTDFSTEKWTTPRFMDILLNYWLKTGKVIANDPGFLTKHWPISSYSKRQFPNEISSLENDTYDVEVFIDETILTANYHEG